MTNNPASSNSFGIFSTEILIKTEKPVQFINITPEVQEKIKEKSISQGLINIQSGHTTMGIIVNENEPNLLNDIKRTLERIAPKKADYDHNKQGDTNGHSHCRAVFLPSAQCISIDKNKLQLGTWQSIFAVELDGPRERKTLLQIVGSNESN